MPATLSLSLVSHTNVGKTTLARTLLGRDVGEVRDAAHVTDSADGHELLRTAEGDVLTLWDTPGFGDTGRLVRRLQQSGQPIGWLLSEVWDRWRDRPFWATQQALRNVREQADVVLYLVNAAEEPAAAGYVEPEMDLLAWLGKPVLVLLNQMGAPRTAAAEADDVQHWRTHLASRPQVRAVLPLDAFARCWVQEGALWQAIEHVFDDSRRAAMARLRVAWTGARLATFGASMQLLAGSLGTLAAAHVPLLEAGMLRDALRQIGGAIGLPGTAADPQQQAQQALDGMLETTLRDSTGELIALHGLRGEARQQVLERVASRFETRRKVGEGRAALVGGAVTGALTGLKADIVSGGLTLGGGMLAGALIGALGAAGAARGLNVVRGTAHSWVAWNAEALDLFVRAALLRYLAVAHFGRGRGEWAEGEAPAHWDAIVSDVLAGHQDVLSRLWRGRQTGFDNAGEAGMLSASLQPLLTAASRQVLERLYPGSWPSADNATP